MRINYFIAQRTKFWWNRANCIRRGCFATYNQ